MKIDSYQLMLNHRIDDQWEWSAYLWLDPEASADAVLKSATPYQTEGECLRDANKLLIELGIKKPMNKNSRQRKAANPGAHQPRKSTKPKVGASAAEITRRIAKERS